MEPNEFPVELVTVPVVNLRVRTVVLRDERLPYTIDARLVEVSSAGGVWEEVCTTEAAVEAFTAGLRAGVCLCGGWIHKLDAGDETPPAPGRRIRTPEGPPSEAPALKGTLRLSREDTQRFLKEGDQLSLAVLLRLLASSINRHAARAEEAAARGQDTMLDRNMELEVPIRAELG